MFLSGSFHDLAIEHTRFVRLEKDGEPLEAAAASEGGGTSALGTDAPALTMHKVWEYATTMPIEEISFIGEARRLNEQAASASLKGNYGHCHGKESTPFLLARVAELTGGDSLASNIRLVYNNAKLAAQTAAAYCKL